MTLDGKLGFCDLLELGEGKTVGRKISDNFVGLRRIDEEWVCRCRGITKRSLMVDALKEAHLFLTRLVQQCSLSRAIRGGSDERGRPISSRRGADTTASV